MLEISAYAAGKWEILDTLRGMLKDSSQAWWDNKLTRVDQLRDNATGYVWGYEDCMGRRPQRSDDSWEFGLAYAIYAAEFELGWRTSRRPIQDAWQRFLATGSVE